LAQAACLLSFLWDHRLESLEESFADMLIRGKGWRVRLKQGAIALQKAYPELPAAVWLLDAILR
jgi:hypothetical protein